MAFISRIFLVMALALLFQLFFPWWSLAVAAFLIGWMMGGNGFASFLGGFLGIFLLWAAYALYIDQQSDMALSGRVAQLFQLPSRELLIVATGLVGGLLGGFGTLSGSMFRAIYAKKRRR
jgi:hypothetical protein